MYDPQGLTSREGTRKRDERSLDLGLACKWSFQLTRSCTGLILTNLKGVIIEYASHFTCKASNNQAEDEALLAGSRMAKELGVKRLKIFVDSQLVTGQARGEYEAQEPAMIR